jgi:hypothetical protein
MNYCKYGDSEDLWQSEKLVRREPRAAKQGHEV